MTNEQILTCAINIGEQLLINGAEISRVEDGRVSFQGDAEAV